MTQPLHQDEPTREVAVEGRTVRNMTVEEYDATYADGEPCSPIPPDVLAAVYAKLGHTPDPA